MLVRHQLFPIAITLIASVALFAVIDAFGKPLWFDRLFIMTLLLAGLINYRNINIVGIVVIMVGAMFLEELLWAFAVNHAVVKFPIYIMCIVGFFWLEGDTYRWGGLLVGVSAIVAEVWWLYTGYDGPDIYWTVALIGLAFAQRRLLIGRAFITAMRYPTKAAMIKLDLILYTATGVMVGIKMLEYLEYLVRHLLLVNSTVVYFYSQYAAQFLITVQLIMVAYESLQERRKRQLST